MKKDKKSSLSNASLQDVLSAASNERRLGGGVRVSEKTDQDLFILDTQGSKEAIRQLNDKKMRIDQILQPSFSFSLMPTRKKPSSSLKKKMNLNLIHKAKSLKNNNFPNAPPPSLMEIWNSSEDEEEKEEKTPASGYSSKAKAVELPHPGQSYRPCEGDLKEAIEIAASTILRQQSQQKEKIQITPSTLEEDVSIIQANQELFYRSGQVSEEASSSNCGLSAQPSIDDDEHSEQQFPCQSSTTSTTILKRKTKAQRNRQKRQKELQKTLQTAKTFNKAHKQVNNLSSILEHLKNASKSQQLDGKKRTLSKRNARLSKYRVVERMIDVLLPEEVPQSLRELTPEGSLVKERFVSLQKRNFIEPRVRVMPKRKYALRTVIENR